MQHNGYTDERTELSGRIHPLQIRDYCLRLKHGRPLLDGLFRLLYDEDKRVASNTAWIFTHLDKEVCLRLSPHFNELADMAMRTEDETLRRLLLTILYRLPFPETPHVRLLNFCLAEMMSCWQPNGIRSLCMKIAYEIGQPIPEIREEIGISMSIMEADLLPPSLRSVRKNILTALKRQKSLRKV